MGSSTIINIPSDDKVFESNCIPLFAGLLNDPNVKLLGTRQEAVRPGSDRPARSRCRSAGRPVGIQCKLITRGAKLSETTIRKEVGHAGKKSTNLDADVEQLLGRWPLGVAAHIAVADIYRVAKPDALAEMAQKAKSLVTAETSYSDRVMFAQLSLFREAWGDIIAVPDGHVEVNHPSEPLAWLAHGFANVPTQARTSQFYRSLAPEVIAHPRYARLAGVAEHNRGDLKAAERYLRSAISADPTDLRALLLLESTVMRDNREADARELIAGTIVALQRECSAHVWTAPALQGRC